jgi:hypothetical protein
MGLRREDVRHGYRIIRSVGHSVSTLSGKKVCIYKSECGLEGA